MYDYSAPKLKSYPPWNTAQLCPLSLSSTLALKMQMKSHLAQLRTIRCFPVLFESNPISLFQSPMLSGSCLSFDIISYPSLHSSVLPSFFLPSILPPSFPPSLPPFLPSIHPSIYLFTYLCIYLLWLRHSYFLAIP